LIGVIKNIRPWPVIFTEQKRSAQIDPVSAKLRRSCVWATVWFKGEDSHLLEQESQPSEYDTDGATDAKVKDIGEVIPFTNALFGSIRVVMLNGEPWFVGKDTACTQPVILLKKPWLILTL